MLKNVVLPAPFGPMIETIDRSGIVEVDVVDRRQAAERLGDRQRLEDGALVLRGRSSGSRVCVSSLMPDLVERLGLLADAGRVAGSDARELELASSLRQEALGPEHHHDHEQEAEDPEAQLGQVEVEPDLRRHLVQHVGDQVGVDERQHHGPEHDAPDVAQPAEDDHREHEDRERELELVGVHRVQVRAEEGARRSRRTPRRSRRRAASSCTSGTPMLAAATSSSRTAIQARPRRESRRRKLTNRTSATMPSAVQYQGLRLSDVNCSVNGRSILSTGVIPCAPLVSVVVRRS